MAFTSHPPPDQWDDYVDFESTSWPKKDRRHYWIIPTICFNCESACGLLAYVDKQSMDVRKVEGNPMHPGSRGRTCAKGVVTPNQLEDPDRILYPLRRKGTRGAGEWERVSWDEALTEIGGRIRKAIQEGRRHELMYHVGRPGEDGYANRVLQAWGVDGHNSHTNVCSSSARLGHFLWTGADRPSPDYANARTILLLSSHLETGHYFNPHAQRIVEAQAQGATLITIDPRLSNSSAKADLWLPAYSGTEGALLLAIARILLDEDLYDKAFVRDWVNWREYLEALHPQRPRTFESFIEALKSEYAPFTPEYAAEETGVPAERIVQAAQAIGRAGSRFATHSWRAAAAGNLWGWQITRCLYLLVVLTGSLGSVGGVNLHVTNKFVPKHPNPPPAPDYWNELLFPREFPLSFHELSYLLPHFLKEGRGKLDVYFTRVYNPLWTNPDGFSWMEVLQDASKIGLHVSLSPTWSETAWFADYILPMGLGTERHDTMSQETHAGQWLGFRQPVLRVAREKSGQPVTATYEANPGEVWEESEFWVALSWKIDPDGSLGIRRFFESPARPGQPITMDEVLRLDVRALRAWTTRGGGEGATHAFAVHAQVRRVQGVGPKLQPRSRTATDRRRGKDDLGRRGRWGDTGRLQHAVTQAGILLADAGAVGLARARHPALRARACPLARAQARGRGIRPAAEFSPADAGAHAIGGEMALRDFAHQPVVDRHRGCPPLRPSHRRSRQGTHADRLVRDPRLGHRRYPSRGARHVTSPGTLASQ